MVIPVMSKFVSAGVKTQRGVEIMLALCIFNLQQIRHTTLCFKQSVNRLLTQPATSYATDWVVTLVSRGTNSVVTVVRLTLCGELAFEAPPDCAPS